MELHKMGKIKINDEIIQKRYLEMKIEENKNTTEEYINDGYHFPDSKKYEQVTVDQVYLDYGASRVDVNDEEFNEQKTVTLFNQTKSKMLIFWNAGTESQPFIILPTKCEIPPMKSYSFRIKFLPVYFNRF